MILCMIGATEIILISAVILLIFGARNYLANERNR